MNPEDIDNNPQILQFKFNNGVLFYPLIRYWLFRENRKTSIKNSSKKIVSNLLKGIRHLLFKKRKILFFETTRLNKKIGDKFVNTLDDYYYEIYPNDSFIFESPIGSYSWNFPRANPNVSVAFTYIDILISILSKLWIFRKKTSTIVDFIKYLRVQGVSGEKLNRIENILFDYQKTIKLKEIFYRCFFVFTRPKIIFINCGCYGLNNAIVIKVAKDLGIIAAEIQHGVTTGFPYNYGIKVLKSEEYKRYMPDYLLTFGEYWGSHMRNSCKRVVVGHPHLNKIITVNKESSYKKNTILVVSQPGLHDELINAVLELVKKRKGLKINYRLHPKEESISKAYTDLLTACGAEITNAKSDMFQEFIRSEFIFGCYSTSLVEAMAFNRKLFILENEFSIRYLPKEIGTWVKTGSELAEKLYSEGEKNKSEKFWATDFNQNFKSFIKSLDIL